MRSFLYYFVSGISEYAIQIIAMLSEITHRNTRYEVERRLRGYLFSIFSREKGVRLGGSVRMEGFLNIKIQSNVTIYDNVDLIAGRNGQITIEMGSHIGRKSVVNGLGRVRIGKNTSISTHVSIFSISNTPNDGIVKRRVIIGDNVLIGMGAKILPGVTIGNHSTIGAGAVVTSNVPAGAVVVGIPAKPINMER